jgi:hypothetical protein
MMTFEERIADVKDFFWFVYLIVTGWYVQLLDWWDGLDPFQKAPWILLLVSLLVILMLRSEMRDKRIETLQKSADTFRTVFISNLCSLQTSHYELVNRLRELLSKDDVDKNDNEDEGDNKLETTKVELTLPDSLLDSIHAGLFNMKQLYDSSIKTIADHQTHVVELMSASHKDSLATLASAHESADASHHASLERCLNQLTENQKVTCELINNTIHSDN